MLPHECRHEFGHALADNDARLGTKRDLLRHVPGHVLRQVVRHVLMHMLRGMSWA